MFNLRIHEVGMRDGLQMEAVTVPTEKKIEWIDKIIASGVDIVQLGSFVNPAKMPQMADTDELFNYYSSKSKKDRKTVLCGLALNEKGLERGMNCGVEMFCMGVSASETHSRKNTGKSVADATKSVIGMAKETMSAGIKLQVSIMSAFGCGFEGAIEEEKVYGIVKEYINAGIRTISLADTSGHAHPVKVDRMFRTISTFEKGLNLTCHFHNTYGMGLANCWAAMNAGVNNFETAFGGLGGCPFTKLAAGNVCTEDFVHFLQRINVKKDIELSNIIDVSKAASEFFEKELPGFVYKTGGVKE